MDRISNSQISDVSFVSFFPLSDVFINYQKEYTRIVRVYESDKLKLPSKRQCEKKAAQIAKLCAQALTEVLSSSRITSTDLYNDF